MKALDVAAALHNEARLADALPHWRAAIREDPMNPDVWYGAALGAMGAKEYAFAARMLESYRRIHPTSTKTGMPLAICYFATGALAPAAAVLEGTVERAPEHVAAWLLLGQCLYLLGRPDDARRAHERAVALPSATPEDRVQQAVTRLAAGERRASWAELEHRWESIEFQPTPFWREVGREQWTGAPAPDRTLCLFQEGGYGDGILFARFIGEARRRVGRLLVAASPAMARLVASAEGVDGIIATPDDVPPDALHASVWSLPYLLDVGDDAYTGRIPYLHAPADAPVLPPTDRFRVGLVWAGSAEAIFDAHRSVRDVAVLAPLFEVPGIEWISLQLGPRAGETASAGLPVLPCPAVRDFADTAGVLGQLDLLVSIDSAVVNLAGALGRPAWLLPHNIPEFRWTRPDWYPSVRLFPRRDTDDWAGVAARMASALAELVRERAPRAV